jgi:hypothetical protein
VSALSALRKSFIANPAAWVLAGLLAVVLIGSYRIGGKLSQVCSLAAGAVEMPLSSLTLANMEQWPATWERLRKEKSLEGELWRWQNYEGRRIERICGSRELEPHDDR